MGFLNQSQQEQRKTERFVLFFYTFITVDLCIGNARSGVGIWIPILMILALSAAWMVYFSKFQTYRKRAVFTTFMMQTTLVLRAVSSDDKPALIMGFMVMTILVAFFGLQDILWLTLLSAFFIILYHGIITATFELASADALARILPQVGYMICLEWILHTWLKYRNENNVQAYKMIDALMEAERSKDDFLANISHEIRTPVNTICGMSEMALREQDGERVREEVFGIRNAGHNLMSLVNDILDFSQLQQGKMNLEEEAYQITSTINDIINTAMARKGDKPIELIVNCAADIPSELFGDEKKIRRVIMNLVDNAIKFTNEGGVVIDISARRENYGVNLCVTVKDTGRGISEESLEKLFESFSQVDTRRNRQEGGVGLGLAISRALIAKMGGTITVRSQLGKGSIFRFVVPQKVLDETPIGRLVHGEELNIAAYFDMEQFDMITIRDEYTGLIERMIRQLQVRCHVCRNLAELKRRESIQPFTHVFISMEEYQEDGKYFDDLAKRTKVILVVDRENGKCVTNPDIIRLYEPLYILPVVTILNDGEDVEGGLREVRQGKFTAPEVHVLVVDDNRMNIRVIEGLLKEYQIKVTHAASGQEALKAIERMCYDFVFMDHMMPEMDGVETLHRIRDKAGNYYKRVPVIALTANAAPGNREMFLEEGFSDFVAKPIELSVLERVLRRNLPEEKLIYAEERGFAGLVEQRGSKHKICLETGEQDDVEQKLSAAGLDVEKGFLYCGGREKYLSVLRAYREEGEENCRLLAKYYEQQDWANYTIKVHALKSTMRSIGALRLSEMAKALEEAGKSGRIDYIMAHHQELAWEHVNMMGELAVLEMSFGQLDITDPKEEQNSGGEGPGQDISELDQEGFDRMMAQLEEAMYGLDGEEMLSVVTQMQAYTYCGSRLKGLLEPVRKKIEKADYMSAVEMVQRLYSRLKAGIDGEEGAAER